MKQLLFDIYNLFLQVINNENYINIISMLVVAYTSFHVAKYSASKPEKLKIKQQQFENVYLPLYRIFSDIPQTPSKEQALEIHKKITDILDKHYELVFPQLHELNKKLLVIAVFGKEYQDILSIMKHQVEMDYELLKKSLGYPSENFFNLFVRMTFKQKASFFVSWFNILAFIGIWALLIFTVPYYLEAPILTLLLYLLAIFLYIFIGTKLNRWVHNLKY